MCRSSIDRHVGTAFTKDQQAVSAVAAARITKDATDHTSLEESNLIDRVSCVSNLQPSAENRVSDSAQLETNISQPANGQVTEQVHSSVVPDVSHSQPSDATSTGQVAQSVSRSKSPDFKKPVVGNASPQQRRRLPMAPLALQSVTGATHSHKPPISPTARSISPTLPLRSPKDVMNNNLKESRTVVESSATKTDSAVKPSSTNPRPSVSRPRSPVKTALLGSARVPTSGAASTNTGMTATAKVQLANEVTGVKATPGSTSESSSSAGSFERNRIAGAVVPSVKKADATTSVMDRRARSPSVERRHVTGRAVGRRMSSDKDSDTDQTDHRPASGSVTKQSTRQRSPSADSSATENRVMTGFKSLFERRLLSKQPVSKQPMRQRSPSADSSTPERQVHSGNAKDRSVISSARSHVISRHQSSSGTSSTRVVQSLNISLEHRPVNTSQSPTVSRKLRLTASDSGTTRNEGTASLWPSAPVNHRQISATGGSSISRALPGSHRSSTDGSLVTGSPESSDVSFFIFCCCYYTGQLLVAVMLSFLCQIMTSVV